MKRTISLTLAISLLWGASPAAAVGRAVSAQSGSAMPAVGVPAAGASTGFIGTALHFTLPGTDSLSLPAPAAAALPAAVDAAAAPAAALPAAEAGKAALAAGPSELEAEVRRRLNSPGAVRITPAGPREFTFKTSSVQEKDPAGPLKKMTYLGLKRLSGADDAYAQGRVMDGAAALPASSWMPAWTAGAQKTPRLRLDMPDGKNGRAASAAPAAARPAAGKPELAPWITFQVVRVILYVPVKLLYRVRYGGLQNLPKEGPYLLIPNHPSYLDVVILGLVIGRPIRYLMYRKFYNAYGLRWLFHAFGAIPVAAGEGKDQREAALSAAEEALARGEIVAIFPEGSVSRTGNLSKFKHGFETVARRTGVPVVPAHLDGLWGSVFSFRNVWTRPKLRRRIVQVRVGKPLEEASIQKAREAIQYLAAQSMTERIHLTADTLPREFVDRAKRYWRRTAAIDVRGRWTFGDLLTASVLSAGLLGRALSPAPNVGVLLPPSSEAVIANVSLGMAGRVPVNLNYGSGREALEHAVADAGIERILTSRAFATELEAKGLSVDKAKLVYVEDLLAGMPDWKRKATRLLLRALPSWAIKALFLRDAHRTLTSLAAIIYAGASSGRPKGVMLSHRNVQANVQMIYRLYSKPGLQLGALPFFSTFGFTVTMWFSLLRGAGAVYHSDPLATGPIAELSEKERPQMLASTPPYLARYAAEIPAAAFAYMKTVISGAEKLKIEVAEAFAKKFGLYPLEGYVAAELSPVATVNVPDGGQAPHIQAGHRPGTVGQALPGVALRIVDPETGDPVPDGKTGMLIAYGPSVMRGYWNDRESTRKALRGGWFMTGQLAWSDREGFIHIVGRADRFSRISGKPVSHQGVEDALHKAAGADDERFVVVALPDPEGGEQLVVLHTDPEMDPSELTWRLNEQALPAAMVPRRENIFRVIRIPRLPDGKVNFGEARQIAAEHLKNRPLNPQWPGGPVREVRSAEPKLAF